MKTYNRESVYQYAKNWAFSRNPKYYNFDSIGGDCTNFASQCVYAGCNEMNYNKNNKTGDRGHNSIKFWWNKIYAYINCYKTR